MVHSAQFYMMAANDIFSSGAASVKGLSDPERLDAGKDSTIIVAERMNTHKYNAKPTPIYLVGSGGEAGSYSDIPVGSEHTYVIDTGNGHINNFDKLRVLNVIRFDSEGNKTSINAIEGRRRVFVMK